MYNGPRDLLVGHERCQQDIRASDAVDPAILQFIVREYQWETGLVLVGVRPIERMSRWWPISMHGGRRGSVRAGEGLIAR